MMMRLLMADVFNQVVSFFDAMRESAIPILPMAETGKHTLTLDPY